MRRFLICFLHWMDERKASHETAPILIASVFAAALALLMTGCAVSGFDNTVQVKNLSLSYPDGFSVLAEVEGQRVQVVQETKLSHDSCDAVQSKATLMDKENNVLITLTLEEGRAFDDELRIYREYSSGSLDVGDAKAMQDFEERWKMEEGALAHVAQSISVEGPSLMEIDGCRVFVWKATAQFGEEARPMTSATMCVEVGDDSNGKVTIICPTEQFVKDRVLYERVLASLAVA